MAQGVFHENYIKRKQKTFVHVFNKLLINFLYNLMLPRMKLLDYVFPWTNGFKSTKTIYKEIYLHFFHVYLYAKHKVQPIRKTY